MNVLCIISHTILNLYIFFISRSHTNSGRFQFLAAFWTFIWSHNYLEKVQSSCKIYWKFVAGFALENYIIKLFSDWTETIFMIFAQSFDFFHKFYIFSPSKHDRKETKEIFNVRSRWKLKLNWSKKYRHTALTVPSNRVWIEKKISKLFRLKNFESNEHESTNSTRRVIVTWLLLLCSTLNGIKIVEWTKSRSLEHDSLSDDYDSKKSRKSESEEKNIEYRRVRRETEELNIAQYVY